MADWGQANEDGSKGFVYAWPEYAPDWQEDFPAPGTLAGAVLAAGNAALGNQATEQDAATTLAALRREAATGEYHGLW